ncbi:MAG: S8 family serine peptidase [Betaproteobacteria bacterium]|nr:S8 family serine peptidase [Betaproteobacteria bacterium]
MVATGLLALLSLALNPAWAGTGIVPTEILVKYREQAFTSASGGRAIGHRVFVLPATSGRFGNTENVDPWQRLRQQLDELQTNTAVEYAEPDYHGSFDDKPTAAPAPADLGYASQWWLDKVGARQGWAVATGAGITIAVIDSGVDLSHPDLQANLRSDGYNFGDGNANPQDIYGHGTFVAGIVAASCNNAVAGCGLAYRARILPIKISAVGSGTFASSAVAQAIDYAVAHGARVINLSLSIDSETQTVAAAIQRALDAGAIVVASAGNAGGPVAFPGTYPGVITVAGTNQDDSLWAMSNQGPEVALAAPATGVYSTLLGGGFGQRSAGTSYSAPMVTAAVAAMLQVDGRLGLDQMRLLLKSAGHPLVSAGYGFGVLDMGAALLTLLPDLRPDKQGYASNDALQLNYQLPPTAGAADIYVALTTPVGEFSLSPDGMWTAVADKGYLPIAKSYAANAALNGALFGAGGIFPPITLLGMPSGRYTWRIALVNPLNGVLLGPVIESPMTLN